MGTQAIATCDTGRYLQLAEQSKTRDDTKKLQGRGYSHNTQPIFLDQETMAEIYLALKDIYKHKHSISVIY
jgi:hypothetical protein